MVGGACGYDGVGRLGYGGRDGALGSGLLV